MFFKISDLPTGEYQIIFGDRSNSKSAMIMLEWLKSVLEIYVDKNEKFHLGIKPKYNEQECIAVIRSWLNEK